MTRGVLQKIEYKDHIIEIVQDEYNEDPNVWDDGQFLVYQHRDFTIEKDGFHPQKISMHIETTKWLLDPTISDEAREGFEEYLNSDYDNYWIFPIEAYIHSGISLSIFSGQKTCNWDSSVSGYYLISKEIQNTEEDAEEVVESYLKTWNDILGGRVYGFRTYGKVHIYSIEKEHFNSIIETRHIAPEDFTETTELKLIDSCYGFIGSIKKCGVIEEAKAVIDNLIERNEKKD